LVERSLVLSYDRYDNLQDFLNKMDSGELDGEFSGELKKLTKDQLEQVAQALMDREEKRQD